MGKAILPHIINKQSNPDELKYKGQDEIIKTLNGNVDDILRTSGWRKIL